MILYEVSYIDDNGLSLEKLDLEIRRVYFSNKVKAKSFVAKTRRSNKETDRLYDFTISRHEIGNSKEDVLEFLNRNKRNMPDVNDKEKQ